MQRFLQRIERPLKIFTMIVLGLFIILIAYFMIDSRQRSASGIASIVGIELPAGPLTEHEMVPYGNILYGYHISIPEEDINFIEEQVALNGDLYVFRNETYFVAQFNEKARVLTLTCERENPFLSKPGEYLAYPGQRESTTPEDKDDAFTIWIYACYFCYFSLVVCVIAWLIIAIKKQNQGQ